jgi:DNA-binding transcriptional regulator GbsR (MarR family)
MSGLSFTLMILQHFNVIKKALKKGRKFTFLILDVDSKEVEKYSQTFENAKELKNHINSTLEILCELKNELKDKNNLTIKTYDLYQKYGIIIIDKDTENSLVKVEQYNLGNPNTRQNKIAYKVDNPDFYESSWIEYNELLEKSKDYVC